MRFVEVDPDEVPNLREGHRGRVSYPILKSFMETGMEMAMLDRTGIQQSFQSLYSSLTAYIRSHNLPLKLFSRRGQIYLVRKDVGEDGTVEKVNLDKVDYRLEDSADEDEDVTFEDLVEVTPVEVETRFQKEKGKVTK